MPFKIVSTRRNGKVELCTVPDTWEDKGILRWPKMYGYILAKNDSTQPQSDWLTYKCLLKRRNYRTYEEAEDELTKMLEKTDTDDTDDGERSRKRTTPPQKVPNLNAAAQRMMIKSDNPKKRIKQPTSTMQASKIIQVNPTIESSPVTQTIPTIPISPNIPVIPITQAGLVTQAGPKIPASPTIPASPITKAGPIIQAEPTVLASPTIPASPITKAGPIIQAEPTVLASPTIQRFPETSILTNQQRYIINDTLYTIYPEEQENTPQEVHYYTTTNDQNIITQINNIYEIQSAILDNQNKIMKKLAEMSVQLEEIQEQRTENITVTTLAQAKGPETKRMRMDIVDNVESLEKLEKDLSCPKMLKTYLEKYAILCSTLSGSGSNCAYRLLDSVFTKDFLCKCSWTGGSRGDDVKIGFKKYKNILKFFFEMVYYWDNTYTMQDNENFFKSILRNALKRKTSKNIRQSSKKRRNSQPKRVQPKPQNQRSASNDHDDDDDIMNNDDDDNIMNNDDEDNTNNDYEDNINNDIEDNINFNDDNGNHNPDDDGDENTYYNDGNSNTNSDGENNPSNEKETIVEDDE